jgi:ABC-type transport system involved in cytochrome bd biosynthesis fused ATPase/permease subunit
LEYKYNKLKEEIAFILNEKQKIKNDLNMNMNKGKKKVNPLEPILKNINFEIKQGEFICIIGEVGCGKSSLLQAILNNMISLTRGSKIYVNGSISYVSQIPWIRNATIKDNILFYQPYDEEKYNKVIELSQLRQDLEIFEAGDLTEIGEKVLIYLEDKKHVYL